MILKQSRGLLAKLPHQQRRWLNQLTEIGPAWEVGTGTIEKIERLAVACYCVGYRDGRKKASSPHA